LIFCDADLAYYPSLGATLAPAPKYMFDAVVVVEAPASELDAENPDPNQWRIHSLQLRRGLDASPPQNSGSPNRPRPPGS
jgi:hypothetical protein